MHAIEFSSHEDDFIPREIWVHPHVKMGMKEKQQKINNILAYIDSKRKKHSIEAEMMNMR
jgi:hypothetical protein